MSEMLELREAVLGEKSQAELQLLRAKLSKAAKERLSECAARMFIPAERYVEDVVMEFLEQDLRSPEVSTRMIDMIDAQLLQHFPPANRSSEKRRRRVVKAILDVVIDELFEEGA
jgi:hypothetical protein